MTNVVNSKAALCPQTPSTLSKHNLLQMRKHFYPTLLLLFFQNMLAAQEPCGTDILHQQALNNPAYAAKHAAFEQKILQKARSGVPEGAKMVITLPVVVHVVHTNGPENISDAQIQLAIQQLNEAFANTGYYDQGTGSNAMIQFCLAQRAPDNQPTNGITRVVNALSSLDMNSQDLDLKNLDRWDPTQYINVWSVNEICSSTGCSVAGYAFFPSSHGSAVDGIVLESQFLGSSPGNTGVLAHEMGHYLGLYHTFQGGCTNNDCLTDGDRVCDTPPDQSTLWTPCTATPNTCNTDAQSGFATDQNDMISNFMDYTDFQCFHDFSTGQSARMNAAVLNQRASLLESAGCLSPCPNPVTAGFTSPTSVNLFGSLTFTNTSVNAVSYQWTINGVPFSTAASPSYTFNSGGAYTITLHTPGAPANLCFADSFSIDVDVKCPLEVGFTMSTTTAQSGESVVFTNTSVNAFSYQWLINNAPLSTATNASYTPLVEGFFNVSLIASINPAIQCPPDTLTQTVEVRCGVTADFTPSTSNTEPGQPVFFTNNSLNYSTLEWFINGVSQGPVLPSYVFTNPGVYIVRLVAGNGVCEKSRMHYLSVTDTCSTPFFQKVFGDVYENVAVKSVYLDDGTLLVAGTTAVSGGLTDVVFMKLTPDGTPVWIKRWGSLSTAENMGHLRALPGAQFAATLTTTAFGSIDPVFVKFDVDGNPLWQRTVHTNSDDQFTGFNQTSDGGFIVSGAMRPTGGWEAYFLKLDANGNEQWSRMYNGGQTDFPNEVRELPGGGYISSGFTLSFGQNTSTIHDGMLIRLDNAGNIVWTKAYGAAGNEGFGRVFLTADGGYITFGGSSSFNGLGNTTFDDVWAVKTDADGNLQWSKTYRTNLGIDCTSRGAIEGVDGGYVLSGNDFGTNGNFETFFFKINDLGELDWSRIYGAGGIDRVVDVAATPDGYLLPGTSNSIGAGGSDLYVVKTDLAGYAGDCLELQHVVSENTVQPIVEAGSFNLLNPLVLVPANLPVTTLTGFTIANLCPTDCSTELCFNGLDDDGDGLFDCLDPDCDCFTCEPSSADIWYFGKETGLDFSQDTPVVLTDGKTWTAEGTSVISDALGQLLFYTDGRTVYARDHTTMPNGTFLNGDESTTQTLIVPHPGDKARFYIFSAQCVECIGTTSGLSYSVVDMSLNGGLGNVMPGQKNIVLTPFSERNEQLTAVRHCNGDDYWVVNHSGSSNRYFAWLIDANGLNPVPVVSTTGIHQNYSAGNGDNTGQMKFSPDGTHIARALRPSAGVELCDFDAQTGVVSMARFLASPDPTGVYGLEFSPSGRQLYATTKIGNEKLLQYDVATGGMTEIYDFPSTLHPGSMQLAPNGKIYISLIKNVLYNPILSVIHQPDVSGPGCQLVSEGLSLAGTPGANNGLPNFVCDAFWKPFVAFRQSTTTDTLCFLPQTRTFYLEKLACAVDSVLWNVTANTSIVSQNRDSVTVQINQSGSVRIIARAMATCGEASDTLLLNIFQPPTPVLDLGSDLALCDNSTVTLNAGPGWASYRWSNLSTESTVTTTEPGLWSVETRDVCGNAYTDSVWIGILPATVLNLPDSIVFCQNDTVIFALPAPFVTWQWFPQTGLDCADCPVINTVGIVDTTVFIAVAQSADGCNSADTVWLAPGNAAIQINIDTSLCEGNTLSILGVTISTDTTLQITINNTSGCDTAVTLQATAWPVFSNATQLSACVGDALNFNGQDLVPDSTYIFIFSTLHGCDSTLTVQTIGLDSNLNYLNLETCYDETVTFNGQNLAPDSTYTFVFNNLQGCDSTWVVQVLGLDSSLNYLTLQACYDETAAFNGQNLVPDSTYTFLFNNLQGCDSTWVVQVMGLDSNLSYLSLVVCPDDTAIFNGQNLVPDSAYTFVFNNLQGCDSTWVVQVSAYNLPVFDLGADQNICQSSAPSYSLPAGFAGWVWQPTGGVDCATCPVVNLQPNLGANSYVVTAFTAEGCVVADTLDLMVFPDTVFLNLDTNFCAGSMLTILGQNIISDTLFTIFFDGPASCDTLLTVQATTIAPVEVTLVLEACAGDSVLLQGEYLPAGAVKTFVYTAATGCDSLVHVEIVKLDTSLTTINLANCDGQTVVWNGQELLPGNTYLFPFSAQNGCDSTVAVQVSALPGPVVVLAADTILQLGQSIEITAAVSGIAPFVYTWQPPDFLSCNTCANPTATPLANTWFSVTITDAAGCIAGDSMLVLIDPVCGLYVPNVFRPDDDGYNDNFYPFAGDCVREVLYLRVYDRWGELVFERKNFPPNTENMGWDGKFRGDPATPGVYVWIAEFVYLDGRKSMRNGDVTIVK